MNKDQRKRRSDGANKWCQMGRRPITEAKKTDESVLVGFFKVGMMFDIFLLSGFGHLAKPVPLLFCNPGFHVSTSRGRIGILVVFIVVAITGPIWEPWQLEKPELGGKPGRVRPKGGVFLQKALVLFFSWWSPIGFVGSGDAAFFCTRELGCRSIGFTESHVELHHQNSFLHFS